MAFYVSQTYNDLYATIAHVMCHSLQSYLSDRYLFISANNNISGFNAGISLGLILGPILLLLYIEP